jgi:endoribonuclease Dicer
MHLVAELCHVHPLPGSIWKQVVWIPSILHRLNRILVAEELRVHIFKEANIGIEFLPGSVNVSSVWYPIRLQPKKSQAERRCVSDPTLLANSFKSPALTDSLDLDINMMWNFECDEKDLCPAQSVILQPTVKTLTVATSPDKKSSNCRSELPSPLTHQLSTLQECPGSIEEQRRKWANMAIEENSLEGLSTCKPETLNLKFDSGNPSMLSKFGPSPGMVLEALTLAKTHEGFDLERLETIGDSILKLAISIYVYGETSRDRCDEGRLSVMRMRQINNKHLFNLGQKKSIGEFTVAQSFDLMRNFLPPGFKTPTDPDTEINQRVQQFVLMKNVADCMEALIGVYLTTTGVKGSIKLMNWLGLKTVPKFEIVTFNEINGFPILPTSFGSSTSNGIQNEEQEDALSQLYSGLDLFEKRLRYTFKNKALLIEALTHASYIPNRITNCYQRLEFLGDAVLGTFLLNLHY